MYYNLRRVRRQRMMRRTVYTNHMKDAVATIKSYIPDFLAVCGIGVVVFYLMPIFLSVFAATIK